MRGEIDFSWCWVQAWHACFCLDAMTSHLLGGVGHLTFGEMTWSHFSSFFVFKAFFLDPFIHLSHHLPLSLGKISRRSLLGHKSYSP